MNFQLGANHRPAPVAIRYLSRYASLHLMQPPASADWYAKAPADGDPLANDRYGCCVPAADYQLIRVHLANAWGSDWKPTAGLVLRRYARLTGFNLVTGQPDNGTDTATDLIDWCSNGIRLDDQNLDVPRWATINPANDAEVGIAIAHLGGVQLTLNLPAGAEDLSTWAQSPGTGPDWVPGGWGMHRTTCSKYDGRVRTTRTWGQDVIMHPDFWDRYVVAVDALLSRQWLLTTGLSPAGLDWDALAGDIAAI